MASFRKLESGRWQARVYKDGEYVPLGTFRTKKEAEIEAARAEEKIYYGHTLNDRNKNFKDLALEWLNTHKKNNIKDSTFEQYEVIVRLHILPFFGRKKVSRVKRADIKDWLNEYADAVNKKGKEKYSYGSRLKYLSVLKSMFHYALHELEILEKNPADKLKIPVKDKIKIKRSLKYYRLEELNKLLDFVETYQHQRYKEYRIYYMLMYFLSQTGLRISEALALKWTDLDGDMLTIERQTRRNDNNGLKLTTLKNSASYRTIKLEEDVLGELLAFRIVQDQMFLKYENFKRNPDGIIFQNYLGNYLTPSTVRDTIKDHLCKNAGVSYKGTHGFRHTHAVLLLEAGASIKFVCDRLGHKTIKTTADTYLDITDKIEKDELKKFASYTKR